jgi:uncharacterized protein YyaL (SSP411 family)
MAQQRPNRLISESSPYLLQHAHNPVNWYPWGEEALKRSVVENKLLIISIGYAACHWCHVMEHESFEDTEVADMMNSHFISIKVDREERPDIDQVYMNAVQILTGAGGWPLNIIALPDGKPVFGGTYFPKNKWMDILTTIHEYFEENPEKTAGHAIALTDEIRRVEINKTENGNYGFSIDDLGIVFESLKLSFDHVYGGFRGAPKFPMPVVYQFLLYYHNLSGSREALNAVTFSLRKIAEGGIFDQIGGGFARYATDEKWRVPHFEKMLYDNAQLVSLYSSAFQLTKDPLFREVVGETLSFVRRELCSPDGLFYSSIDADSEGEEGKYYVWTTDEIKEIAGDSAPLITDYFNIIEAGNWDNGKNIPYRIGSIDNIATKHNLTTDEAGKVISMVCRKLLDERAKRVPPDLDDKILTSWNALMIKAYTDSYRAFDEEQYLDIAKKAATLIIERIISPDHSLWRSYKNGMATISGFLDDYAFTIDSFISLYQATFEEKWLYESLGLVEYVIDHFSDPVSNMFFYTSDTDPPLIARKHEITDNVTPSSNSVMAKNLFVLGNYFHNEKFIDQARRMAKDIRNEAMQGGPYYSNWDILFAMLAETPYEIAITGNDIKQLRRELDKQYLPGILLSGSDRESNLPMLKNRLIPGKTTIYVCREKKCELPVSDVYEAIELMKKRSIL